MSVPLGPARPFTLAVPEAEIEDLRRRLGAARWPDAAPGLGWPHGTDRDWLQEMIGYWRTGFDWRRQEARLNALPGIVAPIDDIEVHALHVPGRGPSPLPLLLAHGWPGSVFEFLDLIPRLADPARFGGDPSDAFTVIVPSLPGYPLSFRPEQRRLGIAEIAAAFAKLMTMLGYERFGMQGGDWGSLVGQALAASAPERVTGLHLNLLLLPAHVKAGPDVPEEQAYRRALQAWKREESGYMWVQGTRPQTLAYALNDSPVGLAAWILEKVWAWSGRVAPDTIIDRDTLLANVSLYWFTGAIGASFWPYYDRLHGPWPVPGNGEIHVPTGYAAFPDEPIHPPRSLAERVFTDLRRWTPMERGGHFAAMQCPDLLAQELRDFFRPLR